MVFDYNVAVMHYVTLIQLFLFLLSSWYPTRSTTDALSENVTVIIEQGSHLEINGSTNVNTFSCHYQGQIGQDTMNVRFTQVDNGTLHLNHARLTVDIGSFDCGNQVMNKDFRNLLEYEHFPHLNLNIISLKLSEQKPGKALARVSFTIAGEEEVYDVPVNINSASELETYHGEKSLDITDFNLTPPRKFLGMVIVDKEVSIDFRIKLRLL